MTAYSAILSHARSSVAWRFNAAGIFEQVPANQPRFDYDPATLQPRGLLIEESRTNLFLNSSQISAMSLNSGGTTTADTTIAPDGTLTADTINMTGSAFSGVYRNSVIASASSQPIWSIFLMPLTGNGVVQIGIEGAAFTQTMRMTANLLTGQIISTTAGATAWLIPQGNGGYYRLGITAPINNAGSPVNVIIYSSDTTTKSFAAWGGDCALGLYPLSHIPTAGAAVTRAADVVSASTLSPWFNPLEGSLYVEASPLSLAGPVQRAAAFSDGTQQNRLVLDLAASTGAPEFLATAAGVSQAALSSAAASGVIKLAAAFGATDYRLACNGVLGAGSAPGGAMPTITRLELGQLLGAQFFNGYLRRVRYFPRRLSSSELQALTA